MFKESQEGQTHYENDNCGIPDHNKPQEQNWELSVDAETDENLKVRASWVKEFAKIIIAEARQQAKTELLKELGKKIRKIGCESFDPQNCEICSFESEIIQVLKDNK